MQFDYVSEELGGSGVKNGVSTVLLFVVIASFFRLIIRLPVFFVTWLFVGGDIVIRSGVISLLSLIITAVGIGILNNGIAKELEEDEQTNI